MSSYLLCRRTRKTPRVSKKTHVKKDIDSVDATPDFKYGRPTPLNTENRPNKPENQNIQNHNNRVEHRRLSTNEDSLDFSKA